MSRIAPSYRTAISVLLCELIIMTGSLCLAQRNALPTALPPQKKPCEGPDESRGGSHYGAGRPPGQ